MSEEEKLGHLRSKLQERQDAFDKSFSQDSSGETWHSVSVRAQSEMPSDNADVLSFVGKNLENGKFAAENLQGANFSVANLTGVNFVGADLRGVDFSGANLTDADLTGADLTGAVLSGAVLHRTNFTKAKMHGVKLVDADLEDAILLDLDIDSIGIEELQELIEYIAKYYPHKLNLSKINLTLLRLASIDLSQVNLRGVDFTGVDFTGVNLVGLDLSECIITPEQIAQALGHVPGKEELARILAPKKKKQAGFNGLDMTELLLGNGREFGILDFQKDKGISIETLMKVGKKVFGVGKKPQVKDEEALANVKNEREMQVKSHNEELRKIIEQRKQQELENRRALKENVAQEKQKESEKLKQQKRDATDRIRAARDSGRGY
jgi:uncharacterized protein YjbI with pentapeptide repeats